MKTYDLVDGRLVEIDPGSGGSFEIRDMEGEKRRIRTSAPPKPHPDGDRPRDPEGRPLDQLGRPITGDAKPEGPTPALPPAGRAPWEPPEEDKPKSRSRRGEAAQTEGG